MALATLNDQILDGGTPSELPARARDANNAVAAFRTPSCIGDLSWKLLPVMLLWFANSVGILLSTIHEVSLILCIVLSARDNLVSKRQTTEAHDRKLPVKTFNNILSSSC
jgi:hypothetical protein